MPDIVPTNPSSDKIGTTSKPFGEMNADAVKVGGTDVALSNRALDAFGAPSDSTDLDATESLHGLMSKAMVTKLNGIEAAATADQSNAEIETAYNTQVSQVSSGEITAGTVTDVRRFSPADVKSMIDDHTAGSYTNEAAQDAVGGILTDTHTVDFTYDDASNEITADLRKKTTSMISGSEGQLSSDIGGTYVVLGSTGTTAAAGNDSRFPSTDEAAALAGSASPSLANPFQTLSGAKTIALDEFTGSLTDNTTGDATTSRHGLLPKTDKIKLDSVASFGTAAPLNAGTSANNVVQLDGSAALPAVDASALTNVPRPQKYFAEMRLSTDVTTHSNADTVVPLDVGTENQSGMVSTSNNRIIIQRTGIYMVRYGILTRSGSDVNTSAILQKNGSDVARTQINANGQAIKNPSDTVILSLTQNDYLQLAFRIVSTDIGVDNDSDFTSLQVVEIS